MKSGRDGIDGTKMADGATDADITIGDSRNHCGEKNMRGRHTNGAASACTGANTMTGGTRFPHIEVDLPFWTTDTLSTIIVTWQHLRSEHNAPIEEHLGQVAQTQFVAHAP
jgi:hypothetical protein